MNISDKMGVAIEIIAREEASKCGFDIESERHGLFRAMAMVFSDKKLLLRAVEKIKTDDFIEEARSLGIPIPKGGGA